MARKTRAKDSGGANLARMASEAASAALTERFFDAQYVWTSFLLEHLVSVRQRLGDLDTALLLTVIGLSALQGARAGQVPDAPVNAHSLALVTGIPRETVRRKLAALGRRGWIEPSPDGGWRLVIEFGGEVAAYRNLDDLTQDTNRRLGLVEQLVLIGTREQ